MEAEPKTATGLAMLSYEEQQLEYRARRVAMAAASQMVDRFFDPDRIEGMHDVRRQIVLAAEHAAYEAIQQERKLFENDMKLVRHWMETRFADAILNPSAPMVAVTAGEQSNTP